MKKSKVLVIGHKNPDTDSICSAICYANLKQKITGESFIASRAGQINGETKFVLNRFKAELPSYINDVRTQVRDIEIRKTEGIDSGISVKKAWSLMKELDVATLPVTKDGTLEGIISVKDIATANMDIYDNTILASANTDYRNILETLDAELIVGDADAVVKKGKILIGAANPDLMESFIEDGDIVIMGNRYESQLCAIEMSAGCIILCMNAPVSRTIKKLAEDRGCSIIVTPHDTYTASRLINQSTPIRYFMISNNLITFDRGDFIDDIKSTMAKVRHRDFPVLDNEKYCGMISRRFLFDYDKKKIILVDHNEKSQAVDGLDGAEILEIIDHHRLGSLETIAPVFFRNQPLGCTATIIYQMYCENNVEIDRKIAGLLCAAIISDTLMFRSPTCTAVDKAAVETLSKIAEIDIVKFAEEMFAAGSNLSKKSPEEIFYQDYKKFNANEITFGVGQINSMNSEVFEEIKPKLISYMDSNFNAQGVDMIFFMLTNILSESTELIVRGSMGESVIENAFSKKVQHSTVLLEGVVSRKKQLIPKLMLAMQQ